MDILPISRGLFVSPVRTIRPVPGERFELPTNGLQNRCSTTELTRLAVGTGTA
jgi:hypothetical protein